MEKPGPRLPEGGQLYLSFEQDVTLCMRKRGMTREEAEWSIVAPVDWMRDILREDADVDAIVTDARAQIAESEATYGRDGGYDIMRSALVGALVQRRRLDLIVELLMESNELALALDQFVQYTTRAVRQGVIAVTDMLEFATVVQTAFMRSGKGDAYLLAAKQANDKYFSEFLRSPLGAQEQHEPDIEDPEATAAWPEISALGDNAANWAEHVDPDERLRATRLFAGYLDHILSHDKIKRKEVESLKEWFEGCTDLGDIIDAWRFFTARRLYEVEEHRFGLGMARTITDSAVIGALSHTLLEQGRQDHALEVAQVIPDGHVFARTLLLGEWDDRAPIDALLVDMTVATAKNARRYDPQYRIAVAQGLQSAYEEAGDQDTAAIMQKRAELLQRQLHIGFIKGPKKK